MKITFVGKYPPISGGESTKLYWLARSLAKRGNECRVVSDCQEKLNRSLLSIDDLSFLQSKGVELYSTSETTIFESERDFKTERLADLAIRTIGNRGSDVVVGWYLVPYGTAALIAAHYSSKPVVLQHAGSDMKRLFGSTNLKTLLMNSFASADGIMSYPSYYQAFSCEYKNVFLHRPLIDASALDECPDFDVPEQLKNRKIITFLGKISESKGAFDLLNAYQEIGESREYGLLYVGSGNEKAELDNEIQRRGFRNVVSLPSVPPWRVPGILRRSDVFLLGERDFYVQRHFSRKGMEAMLCGAPLVISPEMKAKGVYREMIDEVHCLEIDPRDKAKLVKGIKRLLDGGQFKRDISDNGRNYARQINAGYEDYVTGVESYLLSVLERK